MRPRPIGVRRPWRRFDPSVSHGTSLVSKEIRVTFEPSGRHVFVLPGTVLLEAAARVRFHRPDALRRRRQVREVPRPRHGGSLSRRRTRKRRRWEPPAWPRDTGSPARPGWAETALTIEIPDTSLFLTQQKILTAAAGDNLDICRGSESSTWNCPRPPMKTPPRTWTGFAPPSGRSTAGLSVLRTLPAAGCGKRRSRSRRSPWMMNWSPSRPATPPHSAYGLAFDIGTTTLVGTLVDLTTGRDLAVAAKMNPQAAVSATTSSPASTSAARTPAAWPGCRPSS